SRLALQPASVGRCNVVRPRCEDVEYEPPAYGEDRMGGRERLPPRRVVLKVQVRAEGADHELHTLLDRGIGDVSRPQVEPILDAGGRGPRAADVEHALG